MLLQWLKCVEEDETPMPTYIFESKNIVFCNQGSDVEPVLIDTQERMKYLMETVNPSEMLKDSLILDFKELWWKMAFADIVVDLFETSTWEGVDYAPLLNIIHAKIAPHAVHQ